MDMKWQGNVSGPGGTWTLWCTNEELANIYYAVDHYKDALKKDMATQFDGNKEYGIEDDMFLGSMIGSMSKILFDMSENQAPHDAVKAPEDAKVAGYIH